MLVCWRTNYTESCSIFNFCWDYGKVDGIFLTDSSKACNTSTQAHFFHFLICILDSQSSCVVGSWLPRLIEKKNRIITTTCLKTSDSVNLGSAKNFWVYVHLYNANINNIGLIVSKYQLQLQSIQGINFIHNERSRRIHCDHQMKDHKYGSKDVTVVVAPIPK